MVGQFELSDKYIDESMCLYRYLDTLGQDGVSMGHMGLTYAV